MDPLRNYLGLVTNGNFEARCSVLEGPNPQGEIIGHDEKCLLIKNGYARKWHPIRDCTLIARSIEDMDDEELFTFSLSPRSTPEGIRQYLIHRANHKMLRFDVGKNLVDIGVYPGPQTHFEDGMVIRKSEVKL